MANKIVVGCKVRFTGKFLHSTGQLKGGSGRSTWTVQAITENGWVVTDEVLPESYLSKFWTPEELEQDRSLRFLRIAISNLQAIGSR